MPAAYFWDINQTARNAGFNITEHKVTTSDGYVLGMFRVYNNSILNGHKAPAVFMQHGLFQTADSWMARGKDLAPAFQLARAGYDVYLGNNRGNMYSNKNIHISDVNSEAFNNFSFTEYGKYDMPTQVNEALRISG